MNQIWKGLTRPWPIYARLCRGPRCHSYCAHTTTDSERWEPCHCANERFANSNHVGFLKKAAEPFPVLFVTEGINIRSHGLVYIHSQRGLELFGYSRHIR